MAYLPGIMAAIGRFSPLLRTAEGNREYSPGLPLKSSRMLTSAGRDDRPLWPICVDSGLPDQGRVGGGDAPLMTPLRSTDRSTHGSRSSPRRVPCRRLGQSGHRACAHERQVSCGQRTLEFTWHRMSAPNPANVNFRPLCIALNYA